MDIESLRDLLAAHAAGSISGGARARSQPKQTVSRRLMALEADLETRLIDRSTRAFRLTAEGVILAERATRIIADLDEARRALVDRAQEPTGLLRLSAPVLMGQTLLGPIAASYLHKYPSASLEIALSDRRVDLVEEGFDASIRVGELDDSSLISRQFARAHTIIVASPHLLSQCGAPVEPNDLKQKPCIMFGAGRMPTSWSLKRESITQVVAIAGRAHVSSLKLAHDMAVAGAGFAAIPAFLAQDSLQSGALARVLPDWNLGEADLHIVFPSRRLMSARLRAFIEMLVKAFPDRRL